MRDPRAILVLENGLAFAGRSVGAPGEAFGEAVFNTYGHEETGHKGKMVGHMAFIAVTEVGAGVFGPLVSLRQ